MSIRLAWAGIGYFIGTSLSYVRQYDLPGYFYYYFFSAVVVSIVIGIIDDYKPIKIQS